MLLILLGHGYRMRHHGSSTGHEGTPSRRSARQAGHNPDSPPPPPPPPHESSQAQLMLMIEEKRNQELATIMARVNDMITAQHNKHGSRSKLSDFQRTNPPIFQQATYPLEANDWLRTLEKKLEISHCEKRDKVGSDTHVVHVTIIYYGLDLNQVSCVPEDIDLWAGTHGVRLNESERHSSSACNTVKNGCSMTQRCRT